MKVSGFSKKVAAFLKEFAMQIIIAPCSFGANYREMNEHARNIFYSRSRQT